MPSKQPEIVLELAIASGMATILRQQFPEARIEAHGFNKSVRRKHLPFKYEAVLLVEQADQKAEFYLYYDPTIKGRAGQVDMLVYARLSGKGGYKRIFPQPGREATGKYDRQPMVTIDLQTPDSVPQLATAVEKVLKSHVFVPVEALLPTSEVPPHSQPAHP